MGNRAVITTAYKPEAPAIYLHWNGGPESVLAFLHAARDLGFSDPMLDSQYGMGYLQAVTAVFFGNGRSTGSGAFGDMDADNGDNGTYLLGKGFKVIGRVHAPDKPDGSPDQTTEVEELDAKQFEKYVSIRESIKRRWKAAMEVKV